LKVRFYFPGAKIIKIMINKECSGFL